jgi:hypothetical protein
MRGTVQAPIDGKQGGNEAMAGESTQPRWPELSQVRVSPGAMGSDAIAPAGVPAVVFR